MLIDRIHVFYYRTHNTCFAGYVYVCLARFLLKQCGPNKARLMEAGTPRIRIPPRFPLRSSQFPNEVIKEQFFFFRKKSARLRCCETVPPGVSLTRTRRRYRGALKGVCGSPGGPMPVLRDCLAQRAITARTKTAR